jgi:hypothetical protein
MTNSEHMKESKDVVNIPSEISKIDKNSELQNMHNMFNPNNSKCSISYT